jgi:hypothetical protein
VLRCQKAATIAVAHDVGTEAREEEDVGGVWRGEVPQPPGVFGGCDQYTAEFFSRLSEQTTIATASLSEHSGRTVSEKVSASLQGRALLLPDEIIRPAKGQATIFAATPGVQEMSHAEVSAIVSRETWEKAQERRAQNKKCRGGTPKLNTWSGGAYPVDNAGEEEHLSIEPTNTHFAMVDNRAEQLKKGTTDDII